MHQGGIVSDLFILDHSLATKSIQTSHRHQRFVFGLPFQTGLIAVVMCRHTMCRGLSNNA